MEWSSDYITMMFDFIDSSHVASHPQLAKKKNKRKNIRMGMPYPGISP